MAGKGKCTAPTCGQPVSDGFVCTSCLNQLLADLKAVPDLVVELEVTLTRQDRFAGSVGVQARSAEKPLPFHGRASKAASALARELGVWCHDLAGCLGVVVDVEYTPAALAGWLVEHVDAVRTHPAAGELVAGVGRVVAAAVRVVDRPVERWYAGPCACGEDLYARSSKGSVQCPACGAVYDIEQRREELLTALEDQLATASEVCRVLGLLGWRVTPSRIRGWVHRNRLVARPPHPGDSRQHPRYRIGDVHALAKQSCKKYC